MLPERLCNDFPELTVPLEPYTEDFAGVLAQILRPNVYGYSLDAPNIAYVGGKPMLIQNPYEPSCDEHEDDHEPPVSPGCPSRVPMPLPSRNEISSPEPVC
jgi:hypothetical protein